jgi:hypothetical protein
MGEDIWMSYQRYISSAAWRNNPARLEELEASGRRCRICNVGAEDAELQVHHRTYKRLYAELPEDLTTLCADCHRGVTSMLRDRRYACRTPKRADVARPLINSNPLIDSAYGAINDHKRIYLSASYRRTSATDAFQPAL